jgi:hypothetical protein
LVSAAEIERVQTRWLTVSGALISSSGKNLIRSRVEAKRAALRLTAHAADARRHGNLTVGELSLKFPQVHVHELQMIGLALAEKT